MIIVSDAGHGGRDPGAIDPKERCEDDEIYIDEIYTEESQLVLEYHKQFKQLAEYRGHTVISTRKYDEYIKLSKRVNIANEAEADIFISWHANAFHSPVANGIETLHFPGSNKGKTLAEHVQKRLIQASNATDRGLKPRGNLYVLKHTHMPAVLVELGFISNPKEEEKLHEPWYQNQLIGAVLKGVENYD